MRAIETRSIKNQNIAVPGSKSYTHRIFIAAALADGISKVVNALDSEDTRLTLGALVQMGAVMDDNRPLTIRGFAGRPHPCAAPLYLGNSGTSIRLLTGIAALGTGRYRLTGTKRMGQRPIADLLESLAQIGVPTHCEKTGGCPPLTIEGGRVTGQNLKIKCSESSQYLSALLLMAPCTPRGLDITVDGDPVSKPYIDMTVDIMNRFSITVARDGYHRFTVAGGQSYQSGTYTVEPDCSQAGYFWGIAAITGKSIKVKALNQATRQGDLRLVRVLEKMGCKVAWEPDGITVTGGRLRGITADMGDMPDMVPTLAVVAAFAQGDTVINNVAHLRGKESDRLAAVASELEKMGIATRSRIDGLTITGGTPRGAVIETYDDHRIAMSFAMAGLKTPGTVIRNPECVAKSFPGFWDVLETLYA
ncbi:MAG: 3-phosphoshikimate 1-carboxyvinyltransferase [Desulfobacterales bacterium]|nr:3-phosphoshikimate 1-carboxyvinyltransferase [Desulfobacterales bacterium]